MNWSYLSIELLNNNNVINTGIITEEGIVNLPSQQEIQDNLEYLFANLENPGLKPGYPPLPAWDKVNMILKNSNDEVVKQLNFTLQDFISSNLSISSYLKLQYDNLIS